MALATKSKTSIIKDLENLARQDSYNTYPSNDYFTSVTGAKRNPKPFIIGFIAPDHLATFTPVVDKKTSVGDVSSTISGAGSGSTGAPPGSRTPGLQQTFSAEVSNSDIRNGIIATYTKIVGSPPTEESISLLYGHMVSEVPFSAKGANTKNYNLGNVHAGGGTSKYPNNDPNQPPLTTPIPPKEGSYFLTTDYDGNGKPYACYMKSYASVEDAVAGQIGSVLYNWKGTRTAQTAEDYNKALLPGAGHNYHETDPEKYTRALKGGQSRYYSLFRGVAASNQKPSSKPKIAPSTNKGITSSKNITGSTSKGDFVATTSVMVSDNVTDPDDPLSNSLGRKTNPDKDVVEKTQKQVDDINKQIDAMKQIPPLLLLINPSGFERSYERIADSSSKGRQGNIVHMWTENPLSISCKGVTAAQYAIDASGHGGLTGANRIHSLSYENLMSLVLMYRNNGMIFTGKNDYYVENGSDGIALLPASIYIYYDGHVYIGSFDDFSVDDSGDKPYNMEYSFKFTVRYDIETPDGGDGFSSGILTSIQ